MVIMFALMPIVLSSSHVNTLKNDLASPILYSFACVICYMWIILTDLRTGKSKNNRLLYSEGKSSSMTCSFYSWENYGTVYGWLKPTSRTS